MGLIGRFIDAWRGQDAPLVGQPFRDVTPIRSEYDAHVDYGTAELLDRMDGWQNSASGLGIEGVDKAASTVYGPITLLHRESLSRLYTGDGISANIINAPIFDATREGVTWSFGQSEMDAEAQAETQTAFQEFHERLGTVTALQRAGAWARLYGSSLILMGIDDNQPTSMPVDWSNIRSLRWIQPVAAGLGGRVEQLFDGPRLTSYRVHPTGQGIGGGAKVYHRSRVIRLDGIFLPPEISLYLQGWGLPELQRIYDALSQAGVADQSATSYLQDRTYPIWKVSGLDGKKAAKGPANLMARFALLTLAKSAYHAIVLDKDKEDFTVGEVSANGLADLLRVYPSRVAGNANIPVTRIYGVSPAGLNATGESDHRQYNERVKGREQVGLLGPALKRITEVGVASFRGPTNGRPVVWSYEWNPLSTPTQMEQAQTKKINAEADALMIDRLVLTPEEARQSRFAAAEYGQEITLTPTTTTNEDDNDPITNDQGGDRQVPTQS